MFRRFAISSLAAVGLLVGSAAAAQPASELLEKAIYTEETVGDLDQAIEIYQKVIAEGRSARAAAGQAQYRLGCCLLKQKKNAEATEAFQKLIKEYPDQDLWVAKARDHLPGKAGLPLQPAPWKEGEYLQLIVKFGSAGLEIGSFVWSVDSSQRDGKDNWRMKTMRSILAEPDNRGMSRVDVEKENYRPLDSTFRHTLLGRTDAEYRPGEVVVTQHKDGKPDVRTVKVDGVYYDNEEGTHLMRCLPLAKGYQATIPIYASFGGGQIPIEIEVIAKETVEVAAGKFECFKVELRPVNQTFWYSADANRYFVKLEAGGITAELAQIGYNKPGEAKPYRAEDWGIAFAVPAGWYFYDQASQIDKSAKTVHLIDPEAAGREFVRVSKLAAIEDNEAKKSARAWAEHGLEKTRKSFKEWKVQPDSWQERTVAGFPAVSAVGEYLADGRKKVAYGVFVLGKESASQWMLTGCDPADFVRLRADFDKIVETYQAK